MNIEKDLKQYGPADYTQEEKRNMTPYRAKISEYTSAHIFAEWDRVRNKFLRREE